MTGYQKNLAARQERFLAALLASPTLAEAAQAVGISDVTARRWLRDPSVREQYREMRREAVEASMSYIQALTAEAVATLRRLMDPEMPPAVQARASLGVLEHAVKSLETTDILERLERLEATQAAREARKGRGA